MVRLKVQKDTGLVSLYLQDFNSNMVRLKAHAGIIYKHRIKLFQFQHGAIKGDKETINRLFQLKFQFQHGAIKGPMENKPFRGQNPISIPTWCD